MGRTGFVPWAAALLLAACAIPVTPNDYYPAAWPNIARAGDACQGFRGTYENKGELIDERGKVESRWLSDWFGPHAPTEASERTRQEFRRYERVVLTLEPGLELRSGERHWIPVLEPSRQGTGADALGSDPVPTSRMDGYARGGYPCRDGHLHWLQCPPIHQPGGGDCGCALAPGSDGSLIAKCHASLVGIFVAVPFYFSDYYWLRFRKAD